ncbi:hypothetical protein B7P34_06235 [Streptosporangium nondiastaticum]|uniref:Uncharacterized protein n=1 Tax=Streptosporangium nondiastaticum TaxID=35764 RepID=A0A9X7JTY5_9ACTN|nr:hypothetical protein B7P34_06235 [Streptosporangium nondiastaticum]
MPISSQTSPPTPVQAATIVMEALNDPGWGMFVWLALTRRHPGHTLSDGRCIADFRVSSVGPGRDLHGVCGFRDGTRTSAISAVTMATAVNTV